MTTEPCRREVRIETTYPVSPTAVSIALVVECPMPPHAKTESGRFDLELVDAAVDLIETTWEPAPELMGNGSSIDFDGRISLRCR